MSLVHVVYQGNVSDLTFDQVGVVDNMSNDRVLDGVATALSIPRADLNFFDVSLNNETGDMTVAPRAKYVRSRESGV